jgi:nanoRNase/pAp phosphatase (c-di-AMP/oligoRNAs hydrolase)
MNYNDVSPEFATKFFDLISAAKRVIVTGHMNPDEDAVASILAIYEVLQQKAPGKEARMLLCGEPANAYKSFKGFEKIEFVPDIADVVQPDDTLVVVDGSQLYRFSRQPEKLATVKTRICIDHHASPVEEFTLSVVVPSYPAATAVIYKLFADDVKINKPLAEIFLLGIFGDTGTLAYLKPNQLETLPIVKNLLEVAQVEVQEFLARFQTVSQREFAVFMEFCKNTKFGSAPGWPNFQYAYLTEDFVKQGGYTDLELTKGSAHYKDDFLRTIEDHPWGFMVRATPQGPVAISCRSLPGSVNVREVMERMQLGGGHDRAAGGEVKNSTVDAVVDQILDWMRHNKPTLS